jgi:exopolysaccharide production protein ExoQ
MTLFLSVILILSSGAFAPLWADDLATDRAVEGTPALQALWAVAYCVVVALLLPRWKTAWHALAANQFIALLVIAGGLSAMWSENPAVTLRKAVALLGTTLIGVLLAIDFDWKSQVAIVCAALGIATVASVVVCVLCPDRFPATEFAPAAWNGVFSHKNLLGRATSLGALGFLSLDRQSVAKFVLSWSGAALCLATLLASHSQTALLVLLAMSVSVLLSKLLLWEWRLATGTGLLLLIVAVAGCWFGYEHADTLFASLHRDVTFTGRDRIWSFSALSFLRQPWLGYGYGAFWWVASESRQALAFIGYPTPHAHNGFLDLGLQLGFVGIVLFLAGWVVALGRAVRNFQATRSSSERWPLVYLLFVVCYSLTENSLLSPNSLLWMLYVAACCRVALDRSPAGTAHPTLETQPS